MSRVFSPFCLYWHFILDIILTHVYVIAFLSIGFYSVAAFLMAMDSIFKVLILILLSRFSINLNRKIRGLLSAFLRFMLIVIWFIAISQILINHFSLAILVFIFFKFLLALDTALTADFVFTLKNIFHLDLTQSTAAQNILVRSSTAIAPSAALTILAIPSTNLIIFIAAIFTNILSVVFLYRIFFPVQAYEDLKSLKQNLPFSELIANPIMRFGFLLQIIGNLAFSGIAFLLLSELKRHGNVFWNEITFLYLTFFIMQVMTLIWGQKIIPATKLIHVSIIMALCGVLILAAGVTQGFEKIIVCSVIGFIYSILISAIQKTVTSQLATENFIQYANWGATAGRLTSFAMIIFLGEAMNSGISSSTLLISCGLLGMVGATLLLFLTECKYKESILDG